MKTPLISICLPNYNYEKYIKEAIESVLGQKYKNFELIILDDCSTDSSPEIIKSYNDPRISYYENDENQGIYKNMNRSISLANGELICVIHSDDKYSHDFLSEIVKAYNEYPDKKLFITGFYDYHSDENYLIEERPFNKGGIISQKEALSRLLKNNNIGNGVNVAFHKSCFKSLGKFREDLNFTGDFEYWIRAAEKFEFVYIPKMLAYYRLHKYNFTHTQIKNLEFFRQALYVLRNGLKNTKILSGDCKKKLYEIQKKQMLQKVLKTGLNYRSGELMRKMLNMLQSWYPDVKMNYYWYFLFFLSFFVKANMLSANLKIIAFFSKIMLYPNEFYIKTNMEKIVKTS